MAQKQVSQFEGLLNNIIFMFFFTVRDGLFHILKMLLIMNIIHRIFKYF